MKFLAVFYFLSLWPIALLRLNRSKSCALQLRAKGDYFDIKLMLLKDMLIALPLHFPSVINVLRKITSFRNLKI